MKQNNYLEDIRQIRSLMEKSSKFLSLSGISGVIAGIVALTGTWIAARFLFDQDSFSFVPSSSTEPTNMLGLIGLGLSMFVLALAAAVWLANRKGRKKGLPIWNVQIREMLLSLFIPLGAGGLLMLFFVVKGHLAMVLPLSLIFYGLGLVNASKFTFTDLHTLGLLQVLLGLGTLIFPSYALWIWALGFGILHILYGIIMHKKYGS
ncbi:hypothetical protein [Lunatimonas salinarum]|uniref:hypothetical protein n=1 Tax=Lunatimonas salinarum TaxID=1774590 RepID=UPI001ADEF35A|nr:hypothetical protein [Lunatimonas salinarum]